MFHPIALSPARVSALMQEAVPTTVDGWLQQPEFRYPLVAGCVLLLVVISLRVPDLTSWWRARNREIIEADELEQIIRVTEMVIVDLRSPAKYNGPKGHLRGAINASLDQLVKRVGESAKDKRNLVVLVDQTDSFSHKAAPLLKAAGYPWVRVLKGGMRVWLSKLLPVAPVIKPKT
jgi:3-mercaptopyruvate sulfurtransferase SseA